MKESSQTVWPCTIYTYIEMHKCLPSPNAKNLGTTVKPYMPKLLRHHCIICFVDVLLRPLLTAKRYHAVQLALCFGHGASVYSTSKCNCACQSAYTKMAIPRCLQAGLHCVHYNLYFIPLEELLSVLMETSISS